MKHIVIDARIRRSSTGRYVDELIDKLQEVDAKNRYTILLEPDDTWKPEVNNFEVTACKFTQFSLSPVQQIAFTWQLYRLKPDLVHFVMPQQPLLCFTKRVTTIHDLTTARFNNPTKNLAIFRIKRAIYNFLLIYVSRISKKLITPTNFVKDDIATAVGVDHKKIVKTYEAADYFEISANPLKKLGAKKFIFYVGRFFTHKNLYRLVDAYCKLPESKNIRLVFAGKKDENLRMLQGYVSKKYKNKKKDILFIGFVSDEELKWLYENAECYVFPSLSEGFGLPGLEAMAHSCPLVSSNATCLPEVYGDAALYFDPANTEDMAEKINDVITDKKLREQLIVKGHKQIKKYSWRRMAEETLTIYQSVLK